MNEIPIPGGMVNPAPYGTHPVTGVPLSDRYRLAAGLMQVTLGWLGIGRFYTGHVTMAIAQLIVSVFTCGLGGIWGLVDGMIILARGDTDVDGRVLR
jgi:TM2 domain-containing membrane protein YozV